MTLKGSRVVLGRWARRDKNLVLVLVARVSAGGRRPPSAGRGLFVMN